MVVVAVVGETLQGFHGHRLLVEEHDGVVVVLCKQRENHLF